MAATLTGHVGTQSVTVATARANVQSADQMVISRMGSHTGCGHSGRHRAATLLIFPPASARDCQEREADRTGANLRGPIRRWPLSPRWCFELKEFIDAEIEGYQPQEFIITFPAGLRYRECFSRRHWVGGTDANGEKQKIVDHQVR
jgi:hypothetical protein